MPRYKECERCHRFQLNARTLICENPECGAGHHASSAPSATRAPVQASATRADVWSISKGYIHTRAAAQAVQVLFEEALPAVPAVERAEIERCARVLGKSGPFEAGPRNHMEPLLLSYLLYLASDPLARGFKHFTIEVDTINTRDLHCALLNADFVALLVRLPIWREASNFVAPRTGAFPRPAEAQIQSRSEVAAPDPRHRRWWRFWRRD